MLGSVSGVPNNNTPMRCNPLALLRPRHEWPSLGRATENRDELAPLTIEHSSTL